MILDTLKLQAGIQDNPDQEGLDLFAELIVKECVAQLEYSPEWVKHEILKHFGVE